MITIFHGEDISVSRNAFFELKQKSQDIVQLEGITLTLTDLLQSLQGQDLFGSTKSVFIEDLLSKRKSSKELDAIVAALLSNANAAIFLWESKELTTKQLSPFKGETVKVFKLPATIFAFLDAFKPNNGKQLIELFHKTLQDKDPEFVLFMMTRHMRTLLALKDSASKERISEVARMAPWQAGKMHKQADSFGENALKRFHSELFTIDLNMKTGNLALPLTATIDFLLLSI